MHEHYRPRCTSKTITSVFAGRGGKMLAKSGEYARRALQLELITKTEQKSKWQN